MWKSEVSASPTTISCAKSTAERLHASTATQMYPSIRSQDQKEDFKFNMDFRTSRGSSRGVGPGFLVIEEVSGMLRILQHESSTSFTSDIPRLLLTLWMPNTLGYPGQINHNLLEHAQIPMPQWRKLRSSILNIHVRFGLPTSQRFSEKPLFSTNPTGTSRIRVITLLVHLLSISSMLPPKRTT